MENRRRFSRIDTLLEARYALKEGERGWGKCTVIDFSRKGIRAKICTSGEINAGSSILLGVFIPGELEPIIVPLTLMGSNSPGNNNPKRIH